MTLRLPTTSPTVRPRLTSLPLSLRGSFSFLGGGGGGGGGLPRLPGGGFPDLRLGGQVAPSITDALAQGGQLLCEQFFSREQCEAAAGIVSGFVGGSGGSGSGQDCPAPLVKNDTTGLCEFPGSPADLSTPGGPSGKSTMGVFGVPAVAPAVVGQVARTSGCGGVSLIRRCPTGLVLGKDNLCYAKGSITNKQRKWPKAPRPPVTRRDAIAIRRAESARGRVKKLAQGVGFSCKKR